MARVGNGGARRAAMAALVGLCATAAIGLGTVASARDVTPRPGGPNGGADPSAGTDPSGGTDPNGGADPSAGTDPSGGTDPNGGADPSAGTDPSGGTDPSAGTDPASGTDPSGGVAGTEDPNAGLVCTPLVPVTDELARLVIVAGPNQADLAEADALSAAAEDSVQVVQQFALGKAAPPDGYEALDLSDERGADQLEAISGPVVVVVVGDSRGALAGTTTYESLEAFIYQSTELGTTAKDQVDAITSRYDERVGALAAEQRLTVPVEQAKLSSSWSKGSLVVDVGGRAPRTSIQAADLTLAGEPLCTGTTTLPFRILGGGNVDVPALLTGKELSANAAGLGPLTAAVAPVVDTSGPDDESAANSNGPTSPTTDDSGGGGSKVLPIALVSLALALGGIGLYFLLRRPEDEAPVGAWAGGPTGPVPPASPHGPSPTSFQGGGSAPLAGAMPVAPVPSPATALTSGRAVSAPAIAPFDLTSPAPGWTAAVPDDGAVRIADLGLMRVQPMETEHGRTWSTQSSAAVGTAGWLEKKAGRGEDAEPTLRLHETGRGLVGVYDGTGGAGSAPARRLRDGTEQTGAYVASRLARDLTESWYAGVVERGAVASNPDELHALLADAFQDEAEFSLDSAAGLKGSLSRVLPTTMALAAFGTVERDGRQRTLVDALWAGDSRSYILTSEAGLQVLSVDDTRETDALALIRNDQPMENLVAADRPFRINHRQIALECPAVIITATDGCFGYVKTPAHFEYLMLTCLLDATTLEGWAAAVIDTLATFTSDDASFSIAGVGFPSFTALQSSFAERRVYLAEEHWAPFDGLTNDAAIESSREHSWAAYRDLYHARLDDPQPS